MVFLFGWLRLSSNRTVAPLTIWDEIVSIALGSVSRLGLLGTHPHSTLGIYPRIEIDLGSDIGREPADACRHSRV
jgi:hypothetical protein